MATAPGIPSGAKLIEVPVGDRSTPNRFYAVYEFPAGSGQYLAYQFNSKEQVLATFGVEELHYASNQLNVWSQKQFDSRVLAQGAAEEVIGQKGAYSSLINQIQKEAAAAAGVKDPTIVGQIASDPEMQRIMARAVVGEWTPDQIKAEQRKTNFWKTKLYPGIETFYGQTAEPEKAWADYRNQVTPLLRQLGYKPDSRGTFNNQISTMLKKKVDAQTFQTMAPAFIQAKQNVEFATILNRWARADLGKSIKFGDWFGLMAGESIPELEQVVERAQLQWVAESQGTKGLTRPEIENLAARTQLSAEEAQRAFSEFNQSVLALGDQGLEKYGLSRDEVLSAAAGVTAASGRSVDEVKLLVAKTAREQALADDEKINFYVGFTPSGRPNRPGLQSLAPEGA